MKTKKILAFLTAALGVAALGLLPACGPSMAPPNPLPAADAGADAAADGAVDGAKSPEDAGASDAASTD